MSKRRRIPPLHNPLRVGDYLHLTVPQNRHLAPGTYRARIESLATKDRRRVTVAHCVLSLTGADLDAEDAITIHFQLTIYGHARDSYCFLGHDQFPVQFRREDNILQRLKDSLPSARLPYADD